MSVQPPQQQNLHNSKLAQLKQSLMRAKLKTSPKIKTKTEHKSQLLPQIQTSPTIDQSVKIDSSTDLDTSSKINANNKSKISSSKLLTPHNRHLRYLFHEFCKQSYVGGAHTTFDQISQSAQFMTLNKWMVFCKEFRLVGQKDITGRDAMMLYKQVTSQRSAMDVQQFCTAVQILQQKMKIDKQQFAGKILHVDNHLSARNRLCVMQVNFSGPKTNFFIQSQITQKQRKQQKLKEQIFKLKQIQKLDKSYILHQGMFRQHIQTSLQQRKAARSQRAQKLRNQYQNINKSQLQKYDNINLSKISNSEKVSSKIRSYTKQPLIYVSPAIKDQKISKSKTTFQNYSQIFSTKRSSKASNANYTNKNKSDGSTLQNRSYLTKNNSSYNNIEQSPQSKSRIMYEQKKYNSNSDRITMMNDSLNKNNQQIDQNQQKWQINSDAQSDDILKSHYENQKKIRKIINNRQKTVQKYNKTYQNVQVSKNQTKTKIQNQKDEAQTDMMITRYN